MQKYSLVFKCQEGDADWQPKEGSIEAEDAAEGEDGDERCIPLEVGHDLLQKRLVYGSFLQLRPQLEGNGQRMNDFLLELYS